MTYREKLQQEHPECVSVRFIGGCKQCPEHYGYGSENATNKNTCMAYGKPITAYLDICRQCWDREIPEEEPQTTTVDVDDALEALQRLHENAHTTTLTVAFYNTVSAAVEDYGGNAERLYHYLRGVCDLVDNVAALMTEEDNK